MLYCFDRLRNLDIASYLPTDSPEEPNYLLILLNRKTPRALLNSPVGRREYKAYNHFKLHNIVGDMRRYC